ncbi:MAG: trypsin-like serine protease [Bacteroidia bacterium]|nr:trypsin-like serine protease [Bacteroidia bacterium]
MKNILFISLLYLIPFSVMSQKVNVQVIKAEKTAITEWQILDEQYQTVFYGSEYFIDDSVTFTLEANKRYILKISVSEIYNPDTSFYSLHLNSEPIMLISSEIGTGDHFFPFFTGIKAKDVKITGGTDAVISDFPWQVYYISGNSQCGGSIISGEWIVTAAHCTKNSNGDPVSPSAMSVKVGANNPHNALEGKTYNISEVIVHEGYNNQTLDNDIALLKITDSINFVNAVPIKLISADDVAEGATNPGVMSWVTGWGLTSVSPDVFPSVLQKVQLPIVSNAQAATVWGNIPATDIMAGYLNGNKDACNGDSGGPLVVPVLGEYKLAGIVSWGSTNCNTYGAYTRVSGFETWIRTNTGIAKEYKPPSPVGDTLICQGGGSDQYSIANLPAATAYEWKLFPGEAGVISGNSGNASVSWNISYTGLVTVMLRVTVNNAVSDWSILKVRIVQNTKLLSQSKDTALCARQPITLDVVADGYNLIYKWYQNGLLIQSGASGQMHISSASTDNSGDYKCVISGFCGIVFSKIVKLAVYPLTRILNVSPDIEVPFGNDVTLAVNSEGHDLMYKWQKDNVLLVNSNSSQLELQHVNATDIGLYQTIVTGTCGTEKSETIYVYVKKQNYSAEPEVFVWPTITDNEFNVALSKDDYYNFRLFNSMGQLIREQTNCRYQTIVNVNTLPKGVYILNVFNNNFRKSIKVIKE